MNSIKTAFQHLWAFLTGLGSTELNYVETTVVPVLKTAAGQFAAQLAPIALNVVTQLATTGDLPNAKRDAAIAQVKTAAAAAGLDVASSVLNAIVENAYQQYQATTPAAGVASSAT